MSDYQAIYDAVRSRISGGNVADAVREVCYERIDFGHVRALAQEAIGIITNAYDRPSAVFRPKVYRDGNMFCALYGDDIMSGICGFGDTPDGACWEFDKAWRAKVPARKTATDAIEDIRAS